MNRDHNKKDGQRRKGVPAPPKIIDVETMACPSRPEGGYHWLTTSATAVVFCRACKKTWMDLDAELNGATR